ncbi:Ig-like domain-containing protein [Tistlia consotensis]|uniref:Cadherin-like n=1 Tax=Tistlia consotensis USBA 355 TaxID=560819 RepID=A0A1Y6BQH4_9PROT|nr:Ig-like domain-containing protein [Tistlia consotensis]SMF20524.1 Cadherin-like [Tistlia consotensis USBA 355]
MPLDAGEGLAFALEPRLLLDAAAVATAADQAAQAAADKSADQAADKTSDKPSDSSSTTSDGHDTSGSDAKSSGPTTDELAQALSEVQPVAAGQDNDKAATAGPAQDSTSGSTATDSTTADTTATDSTATGSTTDGTKASDTTTTTATATNTTAGADGTTTTTASTATTGGEFVFVDSAVADAQTLVDGLGSGVTVVTLQSTAPALTQIADALAGHSDVSAIHVVSHGEVGALEFASGSVTGANLADYSQALAKIGSALSDTGDILLYGCSVAADGSGQAFIDALAQATGADVAASTDATGAADKGGDWTLEAKTGDIAHSKVTDAFAGSDYPDLLSAIASGTLNFEGATAGAQTTVTTADGNFVVSTSDSHGMYHLANAGQDEVYINYHSTSSSTTYSFTVSTSGTASPSVYGLDSINFSEYPAGSVKNYSGNIVITGYDAGSNQVATYSVAASSFPSNFQSTVGGYTLDLSATAFHNKPIKSFTVSYTPNGQYVDSIGIDLFTITVDTTAPVQPGTPDLDAASDTGSSSTDNLTNDTTPTFTGTAEADSTVTVLSDGSSIGTATADGSGNWTFTPGSAISEGTHSITVTATDAFGNVSVASAALSITIDTTGPSAPGTPDMTAGSDSGSSSTDNITNDTTPTFTGSGAVAGTTVTLLSDGSSVGTTTADGSGNWTITSSTLSAGTHSITATSQDDAGNTSSASSALSVTIDTSASAPGTPDLDAASDTGSSSTDNITSDTTPSISGSGAEAGATVTVLSDGSSIGTATADGSGNWSFTAGSAIAAGTHSITATQTDLAGNTSVASSGLSITIDTTAPSAPSTPDLSAASDSGSSSTDDVTNDTTPTFTGTAEANATVTVLSDGSSIGTTTADGSGNWSFTPSSAIAAGTHTITATATDAAGNTSSASSGLLITIDTTAPSAPGTPDMTAASDTGSSSTDNITSDTTPSFIGSGAQPNQTVTILSDGSSIGTTIANGLGNWSFTPGSAIAAGTHSITATTQDTAGNVSAASSALSITIDTTAPSAPSTPDLSAASDSGSSSTDDITNDTTPTFTGTAEANATVTVLSDGSSIGTTTADGSGNWSFTPGSALSEGSHSITATATDAAGNTSTASSGLSITIDTTAPSAPNTPDMTAASDTGSSSTDNITSDTTPSFIGSGAQPNQTVTILSDGSSIGTTIANGLGNWSFTPGSAIAAGTHSITATTQDTAGNVSAASSGLSITIDTTAPSAPSTPDLAAASDSGSSSTDNLTNVTTPTFTGTAEANATVTVLSDGSSIGTTTADGSGNWSFTPGSAIAAGAHTITATATDAAGNTSSASTGLSITIDTTDPTTPAAPIGGLAIYENATTGASAGTVTSTDANTITWSLDSDGSGRFAINSSTGAVTVASGASFDHETEATVSITVRATDAAGNYSTAVLSVAVDNVNEAPSLGGVNGDSSSVTAGAGAQAVTLFSDATVSDVDSTDFNAGSLTISQGSGTTNGSWGLDGTNATAGGDGTIAAGETVSVGGIAVGTVSSVANSDGQGGNTLVIDLDTVNATPANIQTLLRALTYSAPSSLGARTFTLSLNDGDGTANGGASTSTASFTINVQPNPPVVANLNGDSVSTPNGTAVSIDQGGNATVTDADSSNFNTGNMTITRNSGTGNFSLTGSGSTGVAAGTSTLDANGTISASEIVFVDGTAIASVSASSDGQGTNNLILSFGSNATPAAVQQLIRALQFKSTTGGSNTFDLTIKDASSGATSTAASFTVNVEAAPVNTVPGSTPYVYDGTAKAISGFSVADTDSASVTTTLSVGGGTLSVATGGGATITGNGSGSVTVNGTIAQVNTALAGLSYTAPTDSGTDQTITIVTSDGTNSDTDTVAVTVFDRPDIGGLNGDTVNGAVGTTKLVDLGSNATVTDHDSTDFNLGNLTVNRTDGARTGDFSVDGTNVTSNGGTAISAGDTISVGGTAIGTVDATKDGQGAHNLVITFNVDATLARVQTLLRNLAYTPGNTGTHEFSATLTDTDGATSTAADFSMTTNRAPVNTVGGSKSAVEGIAGTISGISVADADGNTLTTTLTISGAKLSADGSGGSVSGNGTGSLVLTGTADQINDHLNHLTITPNAGVTGNLTLQVSTSDGTATDTDSVTVTVAANRPPEITTNSGPSVAAGDSVVLSLSNIGSTDPEGVTSFTYYLASAPGQGSLVLGGRVLGAGGSFTSADLLAGRVSYQANAGSTASGDPFSVYSSDGVKASGTVTFSVTITHPSQQTTGQQTEQGGNSTLLSPPPVTFERGTQGPATVLVANTAFGNVQLAFVQPAAPPVTVNQALSQIGQGNTPIARAFNSSVEGGSLTPGDQAFVQIVQASTLSPILSDFVASGLQVLVFTGRSWIPIDLGTLFGGLSGTFGEGGQEGGGLPPGVGDLPGAQAALHAAPPDVGHGAAQQRQAAALPASRAEPAAAEHPAEPLGDLAGDPLAAALGGAVAARHGVGLGAPGLGVELARAAGRADAEVARLAAALAAQGIQSGPGGPA